MLGAALVLGWACPGFVQPCGPGRDPALALRFYLKVAPSNLGQYRVADARRSRLAMGWALALILTADCAGWDFILRSPGPSKALALGAGIPLGAVLLALSLVRRNLRHLAIEALGFLGLCLLAPVLVLTGPPVNSQKITWMYCLLAAYFVLGLGYVKLRQGWLARSRAGESWDGAKRLREGKGVLLGHLALVLVTACWAPTWGWTLAPAWGLLRALGGIGWSKQALFAPHEAGLEGNGPFDCFRRPITFGLVGDALTTRFSVNGKPFPVNNPGFPVKAYSFPVKSGPISGEQTRVSGEVHLISGERRPISGEEPGISGESPPLFR